MTLAGIPISEDQCIGDSLEYLNGAFQTLSANLLSLSATSGQLNIVDSANIDLAYQSTSKVLSAVVSISGASSGQMMTYNGTQWGGARPFPTWNSTPQTSATNNQVGSGWVNYRAALLDTIRNNDVIVGDRLTTPSGTYPTDGSEAFSGGVLLKDGRVFCVPFNATTARIYNPVTNITTVPSGTYPGGGAFKGGVLLPDGRVFCAPSASDKARIYDPISDFISTPNGTYPVSSNTIFAGCVLLADGRVFIIPHYSSTARIYNPATDQLITPNGTYVGSPGPNFSGGCLLPSGKVFMVPNKTTTARIYDPVSDSISTPNGTWPTFVSASFGSCHLMPNGKVFAVPFDSPTARIYDPLTDVLTTPSGTYAFRNYVNARVLANGKTLIHPYDGTTGLIYDFNTDTLTTPSGSFVPSYQGVLLQNGKIFIIPRGHANTRIYDPTNTYETVSLDMNFVTSPFNNKF